MLRRCQNLKHRTLHRMVDLDLELCLKFVQLKVFQFLQIVFDVQWSTQNYFVVLTFKFNIKRNSWFFFLFVGG